ncbi:AAA family ATPase [Yoonia sp. BS5-3]|uniref:AAA family ATPase n=1 Tax=Yoonia phaeophyticola TaxID=3137369 RepID=A0ABZ2V6I5_9RHOB
MSDRAKTPIPRKRNMHIEARERKICTIAFIDIVQSTALIEDLEPEDALDRLGPAVELMMDTCEEFGASVQYVGDGALAVFGFPVADENHCIRAVEAGLAVIDRVSKMKTKRVDIRVGLHSGPVLFGNLSHANFDELTLSGPVVHLANKIQSAARINTVAVSQAVVESVGEMFHSCPIGETIVSGVNQPLPLYEITNRDQAMSRWRMRAGQGLSPFMGREKDLKMLNEAWACAKGGTGSAIMVVGEAGIGKSRLVHEFTGAKDNTNTRVLEINANALDKQVAYAPLTRAISQSLDLSLSDRIKDFTNRVSVYLDTDSPFYRKHVGALQSVLHSACDDQAWVSLAQKVRQEAIVEALLAIIFGMAEQKPLVVVFEDMHWADQYTMALCLELIRVVSDHQLMVIMTSRTMNVVPPDLDRIVQNLILGPLDDPSSRNLVRTLLNQESDSADLSAFVEEICGRTPLFIEEIIRNLKAVGIPDTGSVGQGFKVPDSVQPLIAQRIDGLSSADRQTLQIAAVMGTEFSVDLLKRLLLQEGLEDMRSLASLAQLGILENVDAPVARFHHALIQQVAYSTLPKRRQRHLHSLFADIIQSLNSVTNLSTMRSLAFHAEKSQRWRDASKTYIVCGYLALERAAFDDGINHFQRSIFCADQIDTDPHELAKLNMQARQGLRFVYGPKARVSRILEITGEVESLALEIGDDASALGAGIDRVIMKTIMSDVAAIIPVGHEKLEAAVESGAPGFIAKAAFALAQAYWFTGDFEKSAQISDTYQGFYVPETDRLTTGTNGTVSVLGTGTHANALSLMGDFEEAALVCDRMETLLRETEKPYDIAFHAISLGILALHKGDYKSSCDRLTFALETSETAKIDVLRAFLSAPLARSYAGLGQMDAARKSLVMGKEVAEPAGMTVFLAHLLAAELEISEHLGPSGQNQKISERLVDLCQKNGYRGLLVVQSRHLVDRI